MTTYGKLGVKVWICRGEVLPGQMVQEPEAPKNAGGRDRRGRRNDRNDRRGRQNRNASNQNKQETPAQAEAAPAEGGN